MRFLRTQPVALPLLGASLLALLPLLGQTPAPSTASPAAAALSSGPAIGAKVPAFSAEDQNGRKQTLQTLRGPKGLLLLFFRSADWWPYCKTQLVELGQQEKKVRKFGYGIAAISYDSPAILRHFASRKNLTYPLLSDQQSSVIDAFGLRNTAVNIDFMKGIPNPGYFLLDAKGKVVAKYFEEDYRERITVSDILAGRFPAEYKGEVRDVRASRLKLQTSTSATVVSGGQRIRLNLLLQMPKGLHVYAPGAPSDYIPLAWAMGQGQPLKSLEISWPKAMEKRVAGDDRPVPLYEGEVAITREITIGDQKALTTFTPDGKLTVTGEFRYQACTDKLCYPPETVPVSWTFLVASHDRDRVPQELRKK